jgi:protein-L-isoaspartate(D-aspartate) O-methyltransferase
MISEKEIMIEQHLLGRDISDAAVLQAMYDTPREMFVPSNLRHKAYDDSALPIGRNQTISQPYIVAYMAQALDIKSTDKVLEVGAGCGYNAAVMAKLAYHVYSIEIIEWLADLARTNLLRAAITNVSIIKGDGAQGWPQEAPFDKIVITAAAESIPQSLKDQLKIGGKLLSPVKLGTQQLVLLHKISENEFSEHKLIKVRFVPLTGKSPSASKSD